MATKNTLSLRSLEVSHCTHLRQPRAQSMPGRATDFQNATGHVWDALRMNSTPVLIAGAGPTGLVLALSLARRGVSFRIIDEADGPGEHSRAMVVQARTLEFYQQFGFADELIAEGIVVPQLRMRVTDRGQRPREVLSLTFRDIGAGISPYPFALTYPQDDHEKFLGKKLDELGVRVEWNTRLAAMSPFDSAQGDNAAQGDNRGVNAAVTATIEGRAAARRSRRSICAAATVPIRSCERRSASDLPARRTTSTSSCATRRSQATSSPTSSSRWAKIRWC
jgi:hypothetical protein